MISEVARATLVEALEDLLGGVDGARAIFLASLKGTFLASTEMTGLERFRLGGVSAGSLAIAGKGIRDLGRGELRQVHILGTEGSLLQTRVADEAVLTIVLDAGSRLAGAAEAADGAVGLLEPLIPA